MTDSAPATAAASASLSMPPSPPRPPRSLPASAAPALAASPMLLSALQAALAPPARRSLRAGAGLSSSMAIDASHASSAAASAPAAGERPPKPPFQLGSHIVVNPFTGDSVAGALAGKRPRKLASGNTSSASAAPQRRWRIPRKYRRETCQRAYYKMIQLGQKRENPIDPPTRLLHA